MNPYRGGVFQCYERVVPSRYAGDQPKQEIEAGCQLRSRTGYSTEHGVAIGCDNDYQVYKRSLLFIFRFMLTDLFYTSSEKRCSLRLSLAGQSQH